MSKCLNEDLRCVSVYVCVCQSMDCVCVCGVSGLTDREGATPMQSADGCLGL